MGLLNDEYSFVRYMGHSGSDMSIVRAARVSFAQDITTKGPDDKDDGLIKYLLEHDHMTPFEHTSITFHVSCPIFVARQWMRHRIGWSYNEVSRRYTSDEINVYIPSVFRTQSKSNKQGSAGEMGEDESSVAAIILDSSYKIALKTYETLLEFGVAREQARMALPQGTYTRFYATTNLRALMHFVELRSTADAQEEIRVYANAMGDIASELFPVSWSHFKAKRGAIQNK